MEITVRTGSVFSGIQHTEAANAVAAVNRVSARIVEAAGLKEKYNWQVTVVKSSVPNAFVMPNGKIVVYTGILPIAKTDGGLAAIIGHEVAHVVARHSAERLSQTMLSQAIRETADAAAASKDPRNRAAISAALGFGFQYGLLLPFSREHESEADRIGQLYMAKAGYDPAEAIGVWERMVQSAGKSPAEFASTHPNPATRQLQLRQWLPEAQLYYADRNRPLPNNISELKVAQTQAAQRDAMAPVALMPEIREGYWYKARQLPNGAEITARYGSFENCEAGVCAIVTSSTSSKRTVTRDFKLLKIEAANGNWTQYSPPLRQAVFPLKVGSSWEDLVEVETSDGKKRKVIFKTQVVAYESVSVPAGNFMAYRILSAAGGTKYLETWFSPEARGPVKTTSFGQTGEVTAVMTDYQKSDDPAGILARD